MNRPSRSRGFALVECLVLITVMGLLAGLCAGTIHLLLRLDRAGRLAAEESADLARLARDFRQDAHDSLPGDPPPGSSDRLILAIDESKSVEYAIRAGDVLRTLRVGGEARRRETYRRPARASARIVLEVDGPRRFASMAFDRPPGDLGLTSYRDYRIEAELGKHRRLDPRPE